ncbi:hypothetical protein [Aquibacillus albus]|uniref:DUF1295 domain-containing protein n=1 Tax=Aquibacillus albus TaxID=1168171 RepID=A0ABS2MZ30_9BACI|nr:hypothetical protein [Aquibacillus albus]MBM7571136.1 hypothetical protein [Aquibacillus albus]
MIQFIIDHKWYILVLSEVGFWIAFLLFLWLRYWFEARGQLLCLYIAIINQLLTIPLAVVDYMYFGQATWFHLIVIAIYIYAIFRGPIDMRKIDKYIQKVAWEIKNKTPFRYSRSSQTNSSTYYRYFKRKKFYMHVTLFISVSTTCIITPYHYPVHLIFLWAILLFIEGSKSISKYTRRH